MLKRGFISTVDNVDKRARVSFPDMDNNVTNEIVIATHVGELHPGDLVLVAFLSEDTVDGVIIAELR